MGTFPVLERSSTCFRMVNGGPSPDDISCGNPVIVDFYSLVLTTINRWHEPPNSHNLLA